MEFCVVDFDTYQLEKQLQVQVVSQWEPKGFQFAKRRKQIHTKLDEILGGKIFYAKL